MSGVSLDDDYLIQKIPGVISACHLTSMVNGKKEKSLSILLLVEETTCTCEAWIREVCGESICVQTITLWELQKIWPRVKCLQMEELCY